MFGNPIGGEGACCDKVERQNSTREGWQDLVLEPLSQNAALTRIGSLFGHHTALNLGDGGRRDEKVAHWHRGCPRLDSRSLTGCDPEGGAFKAWQKQKKAEKAASMERPFTDPAYQKAWHIDADKRARIEAWVPDCF